METSIELFVSVNSALNYARRRSSVSLSYVRGLTGGSGVFQGATSNTFSGTANYKFTRFWTGSINGGYALDNSLAPAGVATTQFDNWFAGANLGRQVGRHVQIQFQLRRDDAKQPRHLPRGQLRRNRASTNFWNDGKLASAADRHGTPLVRCAGMLKYRRSWFAFCP